MRRRFHTLDVFTDRVFGGNPLAVFPDAEGLSTEQMQRTARELNLSETVFVFPAADRAHTRRVRIFTPASELPFAGHPTVGTALLLVALGEVAATAGEVALVLEEGVGPVPVTVRMEGGEPVSAQLSVAQLPAPGPHELAPDALAEILSLTAEDLAAQPFRSAAFSAGVPFTFVPVHDRTVLARVRVDAALWEERLSRAWAPHLLVFTADAELPGSHFRARMFAPQMGIAEDPATGAAAAAFAGYLVAHGSPADGLHRWTVEQGFEMGRPSLLHVEAEVRQGAATTVRVGGAAVRVADGEMEIPDDGGP